MLKVVFPHAFANLGGPIARLVDVHSRGIDSDWMQKRAAVLTTELKAVRPEKGYSFIHLITMGAGEHYGSNRNGDMFPAKTASYEFVEPESGGPKTKTLGPGLVECHKTFTKYAHAYRDHVNKGPEFKIGDVVAEAYNPEMHRGELIVKVDNSKFADGLEKLARGEDSPWSMSCVLDPTYPVLTVDGYKSISSIAVGDKVLTHAGKWQRVKALNRRAYTGKVCKFSINGLPLPLELTADHPMYAVVFDKAHTINQVKQQAARYFKNPAAFDAATQGWTHSEHVDIGDRLIYQSVDRVPGYPSIDDTRLAQLLGYFVAEGSFLYNADRASTAQFTTNVADVIPRRVTAIVNELWPDVTVSVAPHRNSKFALVVSVFSTALAEWVKSLVGAGARTKRLCPELFNSSRDVKLAFMGAWCDGDGFTDKKGIHWSTASRNLALQGRDLLVSIGIPSSIYRIDHSTQERAYSQPANGIEYTLNVSKVDAISLAPWAVKVLNAFGDECRPRAKPAAMRSIGDGRYAYRVKSIEVRSVVDAQTYNIEVENDESYVLAGLISHNCKIPRDVCSICGHEAPSRKEYCDHLKNEMNRVKEAGYQVYAINPNPLFFDISSVFRPADRIAYGLQKVASTGEMPEEFIPSAQIAEMWGISAPRSVLLDGSPRHVQEKLAAMERLAAMEKQIEATGKLHGADLSDGVANCGLDDGSAESMRSVDWNELMGTLSQAKICLPVRDFFRLVLGDKFDSVAGEMDDVQSLLPGIFSRTLENSNEVEDATGMKTYDPASSLVPKSIRDIVEALKPSMSLDEGPARRRISLTILRGGSPGGELRKMSRDLAPSNAASYLAKQYAAYQLAFVRAAEGADDGLVTGLAVLGNYVT